jgi:MYXO-CTERM domain-containing protein
MRRRSSIWLGFTALLVSQTAAAAPLRVGPGQAYATPCDAIAAAMPGDEIEIAADTYTDSCAIAVAGLTLRGVGGQPKIDLSGTDHPAQYKGIYVVAADGVTIENLELTGAHISADNGSNAAGIRVEAADLTVLGCNIHDNQNGILGGTTGTITIEHTEFFHNGLGDGCNDGGCTHNLYIAGVDALHFRFNWTHAIATDTPDKGHLLKSRAKANYIEYNRITGEDGFDSYEIDLPNGGYAMIVGNSIEKGRASGNGTFMSWGEEGASNPQTEVLVIDNTFVNDSDKGTFISAAGATLTVKDNLFVGPGTVLGSGSVSADNLSGIDPLFVDRPHYDYHLMSGSPAIGEGVEAVMTNASSLNAAFEYVHPLGSVARASAHDVGAFEYGTDVSMAADAGVPGYDAGSRDAGTLDTGTGGRAGGSGGTNSAAGGSGGDTRAGDGGARASTASSKDADTSTSGSGAATDGGAFATEAGAETDDGCSCSAPGTQRGTGTGAWSLCAVLVLAGLRNSRQRRRSRE